MIFLLINTSIPTVLERCTYFMFSTSAIVFGTPCALATKQDIMLVSLLPVTAIKTPICSIFSSLSSSTSLQSPLITKTLFS